ncbi:hypothetical protein Kpol_1027p25 [Vanderwaltozyma polyspora DSM 70294]|uniref:F-box domain-containing protein n=1 Tax=Vanderwaltozyma polyspora (strain ATCC 22028 / DSM 70294 / BCRC 21397 / CBS 2163 / NBRC 10782 / NRRL Y-8283 / UCD 57-17) TaxID=436907 RepID=A7TQM9_VANPO|nr:uncharacterized protein Kpol_1027p25 [Vanderwaltozyma polyspora DSM 70294]EDO15450.1 hypothetical protein Kpol_1027p25 [Vanderwaltozyma polyspora DSM 70294]
MTDKESNPTKPVLETNWSPDIVQATLPFLSPDDIRNLSLTNKYFHKLLNYGSSETLWHELFHKVYSTLNTNEEPFQINEQSEFKTCAENILVKRFPNASWQDRYTMRTKNTRFYSWGCLRNGRLGYTLSSSAEIPESSINTIGIQGKAGINSPISVPWIELNDDTIDDFAVVQISGGGFSFQILTKSGEIYSTGTTFTGGHKGPGAAEGESDYNPYRELIEEIEDSLPRVRLGGRSHINTTGTLSGRTMLPHNRVINPIASIPPGVPPNNSDFNLGHPHTDIYAGFAEMERASSQTLPENQSIRRMFPRNSLKFYNKTSNDDGDTEKHTVEDIKFSSICSGRSHFLALDDNNDIYSWDSTDSDHGVLLRFKDLDTTNTQPILKIGCGWNFNCAYVYHVGLIVWNSRSVLKKGDKFSYANYKIIPGTSGSETDSKVVDFACIHDEKVLFITNNGNKLNIYEKGVVNTLSLDITGKILKITVSYSSLVIFTDNDCYFFKLHDGNIDVDSRIILKLDDPDDHFISLASGDYHHIGLTQSGNIYTWGLESQWSGCLGLGSPDHIVDELHVGNVENHRDIRVLKPTKLELGEGSAGMAVAAGGWQTSALILKN